MARSVLNPRLHPKRQRLLRTYVSFTENLVTLSLLAALAGIVLWVAAQQDHYDPADRDVSVEMLLQASEDLQLYHTPLKAWTEPGASPVAQAPDLGPFPANIVDPEWRPAGRLKQFGPDTLFEKINGEAPKFLKQGFQRLYYLVLESSATGNEIAIELFDQATMGGSRGVFSEHLGTGNTLEQQGEVTFFRTAIGLIGRKGAFFFRIAGDADSEAVRQKAGQLATAFNQLPEARRQAVRNSEPEAFRILRDEVDIAPALISFQQQNVFQYDFAENFWFGRLAQDENQQVFLHRADSAEQAQALFEMLLEEQLYEYRRIERNVAQAAYPLLQHEFLNNYFAVDRRGPYLFGVENAPEPEAAARSMQKLKKALGG